MMLSLCRNEHRKILTDREKGREKDLEIIETWRRGRIREIITERKQ